MMVEAPLSSTSRRGGEADRDHRESTRRRGRRRGPAIHFARTLSADSPRDATVDATGTFLEPVHILAPGVGQTVVRGDDVTSPHFFFSSSPFSKYDYPPHKFLQQQS